MPIELHVGFDDGAQPDVIMDGACLRIGSAETCQVVLRAADACAHHATIFSDRRGLVLDVMPQCARVYVNARPVRERALLRAGDVLSIGSCKLTLKQKLNTGTAVAVVGKRSVLPGGLVSLRVVAGPGAGKRLPVDDELELDSRSLLGCVGRVHLRRGTDAIYFEVSGTLDDQPPRFNGFCVMQGAMRIGDQLAWRSYRFVLEAPGLALSQEHIPVVPQVALPSVPEPPARRSGEVWWLIVTAAVLALGIALLLLLKP
ncbi:MAG: FHA domain-containing protein [Xanthomonadales bacterium]|nr:FHA domain-containing protein [Xanthomonadales bacterium]